MKMTRTVSDEQYRNAYDNPNNKRIIRSVCSKFRGVIPEDVLSSCGLFALWMCLENHDHRRKRKFTSSLYTIVTMYCRRELKRKHEIMIPNPSSMTEEEKIDLRDAVDNLPEKVRLVVLGRFFENKSVAEMAKEMGYTRQYIKQLLDKGIAELHLVYE